MRRTSLIVLGVAGVVLGSCSGPVQREERAAGGVAYPHEIAQGEVKDIQVFRRVTRLVMTNTTATPLGPGRVWVNQRFSREVEGLGVGETIVLDLREFRDVFGESFRAGGFFATKEPDHVVLVEYERADALDGLVVVRDRVE